ncbi:hypothetical protein M405DRAFT_818456 [Rhizopogon salebrosus TDB-379]|nr:hypothetical protein M405DRAFT_818456 [Rhizopogon salebrosus TDB-379]
MAIFAEDPNTAIRPDFTTDLHQAARDQLVNNAVDEAQAAQILATLWNLNNDAAKERWAERLAEDERVAEAARLLAAEEEIQRLRAEEEEQQAALDDEKKKNKTKYAPFRNVDIPSQPIIIPSFYASRKMKKGEFCELFYFTNSGLDDAIKSNLSADPESLVMLPAADGQHQWIPAGAARDPKVAVTNDENLSWEEFNEAASRMINSMKENGWPDDRVNMHVQFWSALQNHRWRYSQDKIRQRALLVYQGQQRRRWHLTVGGPLSYSLARINQDLLDETKEELLDQSRNRAALLANQTRSAHHSSLERDTRFANHTQTINRSAIALKRAVSPTAEINHSFKKPRSFREFTSSSRLPCCAVCLGRNPHRVIDCTMSRTWDNLHNTFSERVNKTLWTKDGRQLCPAWQRTEGCSNPKHDTRHICSGCGATSHGAQNCTRAQTA